MGERFSAPVQTGHGAYPASCAMGTEQGRIKLFGAPRQWKLFLPFFQAVFLSGGGVLHPQTESNTTPPSPKTELTNILFYMLNFASIIKFKLLLFFNILPQQETKIKDYGTLPSIKIPDFKLSPCTEYSKFPLG